MCLGIQNDEVDNLSKVEQAPENFYDVLFSSARLKVSFWKYKNLVKTKVPNGFDLEEMDESELGDIISSRLVRKRILVESAKLIKDIRNEWPVPCSPVSSPLPVEIIKKTRIQVFAASEDMNQFSCESKRSTLLMLLQLDK